MDLITVEDALKLLKGGPDGIRVWNCRREEALRRTLKTSICQERICQELILKKPT